jgi:hypothetical protein
MIKNKILLQISWYIGFIAFAGGWSIFLIWAGSRYAFALDLENLEFIGFFWIVSFFWLSLIALLLLLIYVLINPKKLHLKMLYTALIILVNIPSVLIIIYWQGHIENKVFVKLENQSKLENIEITLSGTKKTWHIGTIDVGSSEVFNYEPLFIEKFSSYQLPDTLILTVEHNGSKYKLIDFPPLAMGECKHLILDENLLLKSKYKYNP